MKGIELLKPFKSTGDTALQTHATQYVSEDC